MKKFNIFISLLILLHLSNLPAQETKVFWAHEDSYSGKIQSSNTDGTSLTDIITGKNMPCGLAIDWQSNPQKIYYCERGESRIMRSNLDGTALEEIITGVSGIRDIELDPGNRKIYWVRDTWDDDAVQRADMDYLNTNIEDLYVSSSTGYGFYGVGLDLINEKVYWTQANNGCSDKIRRMNFDKTGFESIIVYPQNTLLNPWDIDIVGDKLYWTDCGLSEDIIYKANLDGSQIDTVIQEVDCQFFTIDSIANKIYWAENNKIGRANLDGTERIELVSGLGTFLMGIGIAHDVATSIVENPVDIDFKLYQNYPNPFNPKTIIEYKINNSSHVEVAVFSSLGQKIATLVNEYQHPHHYKIAFNAENYSMSSGVYIYQIKSGNNVERKKLVFIK